MGNQQPSDVNQSKQNIDMNQDAGRQNIESGTNEQSPNVTGAGETSRSANEDDIGNPKAKTSRDPHVRRETGRADTDMNSDSPDTMGGDLSSDS